MTTNKQEYMREWKAKNAAYMREYRRKNRERDNAYQREYMKTYREQEGKRDKLIAYFREYHIKNPGVRIAARCRKWGITIDEYYKILAAQHGVCAICKHAFDKAPCIDHCHDTGQVRGFLCSNCNRAIGLLKDDVAVLQAAIDYLKPWKGSDAG